MSGPPASAIPDPDLEGILLKLGAFVKSWKKRYFILKENNLYYYRNNNAKAPTGVITLDGDSMVSASEVEGKPGISLSVEGRVYVLIAESVAEQQQWIGKLHSTIDTLGDDQSSSDEQVVMKLKGDVDTLLAASVAPLKRTSSAQKSTKVPRETPVSSGPAVESPVAPEATTDASAAPRTETETGSGVTKADIDEAERAALRRRTLKMSPLNATNSSRAAAPADNRRHTVQTAVAQPAPSGASGRTQQPQAAKAKAPAVAAQSSSPRKAVEPQQEEKKQQEELAEHHLQVVGMWCELDSADIEASLRDSDDAKSFELSAHLGRLDVTCRNVDKVIGVIESLGYIAQQV